MSINNFLTKENATLLWEVLMDNNNIKSKPREILLQLNKVFNENIESFYHHEKINSKSLIELNKKFIRLMIQFVNKNYPNIPLQQSHTQINNPTNTSINNVSKKELFMSEDIKAERVSQFDKDLQLRQQDFTNAMSLPVPTKPKFNDEFSEQPIGEMEEIIRRTIAQRNYDVLQVNNINNPEQAKEWLKSNETSIKKNPIQTPVMNMPQNKIKYIRIEKDDLDSDMLQRDIMDINDLNDNKNKKQISWADESDKTDITNIFSKLKHIPSSPTEETSLKPVPKVEDREKKDSNDEKIKNLENKIDILQNKMDLILQFITNNTNNNNNENIELNMVS